MKRIYLIILLAVGAASGMQAQQRMQYSQYLLNGFLINPAVGGAERYLDLKTGFSQQWVGFEGAPRGVYVSLNKGIFPANPPGKRISSLPARGRVQQSPTQMLVPGIGGTTQNFHLGLGGSIFSERTGPISYNGISGAFSGHIRLSRELKLSIGASMEVLNYRLDPRAITFLEQNDVVIASSTTNLFLPSMNAGFALYSRSFFIAGASRQLLQNRIQLNPQNPVISGLETHYLLQAGYRIRIQEGISLLPTVILRYINPAPPSWELSLRADLKDQFFIGASYRHQDAIVGMLGFNLNHRIGLQYGYDFTTSNLGTVSTGTHSLVLSLRLANPSDEGKQYFW